MPTVRTYGSPRVTPEALPGVRETAALTDQAAGVGVAVAQARSGQALADFGRAGLNEGIGVVGEYEAEQRRAAQEAKDAADQTAVLSAASSLKGYTNTALYDTNEGAFSAKYRGENALGLPEHIGDSFNKQADTIAASLTTPEQQKRFQAYRDSEYESLQLQLQRYTLDQVQGTHEKALGDFVEQTANGAMASGNDPHTVGNALAQIAGQINAAAWLSPDDKAEQIAKVTSAVHVGVIRNLAASGDAKKAQAYFDETKGQILGGSLDEVQKTLKIANAADEDKMLRGQSQKEADRIINTGGTLTQQLEQAKKIEDPDLRDAVSVRLRQNQGDKDASDRLEENAALTRAYAQVDAQGRNADADSINPRDKAIIAQHMPALRAYAEHRAKDDPIQTDLPTFYDMMNLSTADPKKFVDTNLLTLKAKLDTSDFKSLVDYQTRMKSGMNAAAAARADARLASVSTNNEVITSTLRQYGIDTSDKSAAVQNQVATLRRLVDEKVAATTTPGKEPSALDVQSIVDRIMTTKAPGTTWTLWNPFTWGGVPKKFEDLSIGDVPKDDKTLIEQSLTKAGVPISDATILHSYLLKLMREGSGGR
jgi:hypothetical protein